MEMKIMLFSEIYGSYFNVVASILKEALNGSLTDNKITQIVHEKAFAESVISIPTSLKNNDWLLFDDDFKPVIKHSPTMPLTTLQKRWLKSLLLDPRIMLFEPDFTGLEDVTPLYNTDTFVYFDQYTDGDPYTDENYIKCFKEILKAIKEKRKLKIYFNSRTGAEHSITCIPYRLEYSAKDDKFRLLATDNRHINVVNLVRIHSFELLYEYDINSFKLPQKHLKELVMLLHNERNALERVLLHFSHFEKETLKIDENTYEIKLLYDKDDETELLIRVLSFGPVLKVKSPIEFVDLIKERINKQKSLQVIQKQKNH